MKKVFAFALVVVVAAPALADYVGPNRELQRDDPDVSPPWNAVVDHYRQVGYDDDSFVNRHGNKWNVWRSQASGSTLIWSKDRGLGYNCARDSRPNFWGRCTRYDLRTGQPSSRRVWLRIHRGGTVEDSD